MKQIVLILMSILSFSCSSQTQRHHALGRNDKRHADVALALRTEGAARNHDNAGLFHQLNGEVHRGRKALRNLRPDEHGALCIRHVPADRAQTAAQRVAARHVAGAVALYHILRTIERGSRTLTRGSGNYASDEQKEIARLRRELRDAQDALDVLKKAINILGK